MVYVGTNIERKNVSDRELKHVLISEVRENPIALRSVDKAGEKYLGIVESVKRFGVLNAINVREMRDAETGQKYYSLMDGLHRYTASKQAGLEKIPVQVIKASDAEALAIQLMANVHKVETTGAQYAEQLHRILAYNPLMTQAELAVNLKISPTWLGSILNLVNLADPIKPLVDNGTLKVTAACALSKLPTEEQSDYLDRAVEMQPNQFLTLANARVKELRDAVKAGRKPKPAEFVPICHLRKLADLKTEHEKPNLLLATVRDKNLRSPVEIIQATLAWVMSVDDASLRVARDSFEKSKAEQQANKDAAKAHREAERAKKVAEAKEQISTELAGSTL